MAKQTELPFSFKDSLPSAKIKKMVSPARVAEVLAARNGSDKDKLQAMTSFREALERFERRIKI